MNACLVDTNLIIRFLTGEPETLAIRARDLFAANEAGDVALKIVPLVVAEAVFVLSGKVYGYERAAVVAALIPFLQAPTLDVEKRDVLLLALELYRDHAIDYVDACLAAEARLTGQAIASFDADFRKIPKLELILPKVL
jgi:predicted nucleic acid-binding protein